VGKGGQREILGDKFAQHSWQTIDECVIKTIRCSSDKNVKFRA
jgi:hypothetical protein